MALNKLKFNSLNVTPTAGKGIGFNSSADGLEATFEGGNMRFIKKLTASDSANLTFANGSSGVTLDSTFKEYVFTFNNMHCAADDGYFQVNFRDGSTAYDATKTTTFFRAQHAENGDDPNISYLAANDLAQSTGVQRVSVPTGSENDECTSGTLHLFNPSSTTFVKHFFSQVSNLDMSDYSVNCFMAGYCNTTSAIDGVQFTYSTGNIQSGDICLYGIN
tara:strand:+ start:1238 stop:1894 length:657 start_codon:yes stop_codon:yes gene_type:complete